jgi:hypothetical protein
MRLISVSRRVFVSSGSCRFSPVELFISGIKIVIVDPHNDIVPYWFQEFLRHKCSLIVVFIARLMPYLQDYCREKVNEGNFTCPAFHTGVVGALYHFHPQENQIDAYGRVSGSETIDAPKTAEKSAQPNERKGKWIVWDEDTTRLKGSSAKSSPVPRKINRHDFQRDLQDCLLPTAVGFDLDGLYGNEDRGSPDEVMKKRLAGVRRVLESVARPAFICLARSQTPRSYVPAKIVDKVQESALGLIREIYG